MKKNYKKPTSKSIVLDYTENLMEGSVPAYNEKGNGTFLSKGVNNRIIIDDEEDY